MTDSVFFRLGRAVRRRPDLVLLALALAAGLIGWWFNLSSPAPPQRTVAAAIAPPANPKPSGPPPCTVGLAEQMASAKQLLAAKKATAAYDLLLPCSEAHRAGPDAAAYQKIMDQWQQAVAAQVKRDEQADRARKKREGVRLGMSPQDVLDSSWGKPDKINRTTRASGSLPTCASAAFASTRSSCSAISASTGTSGSRRACPPSAKAESGASEATVPTICCAMARLAVSRA